MVGFIVQDRPDQPGDIIRVMGAVGIDKDREIFRDMRYSDANGITLTLFVIEYQPGAKRTGYLSGIVP